VRGPAARKNRERRLLGMGAQASGNHGIIQSMARGVSQRATGVTRASRTVACTRLVSNARNGPDRVNHPGCQRPQIRADFQWHGKFAGTQLR